MIQIAVVLGENASHVLKGLLPWCVWRIPGADCSYKGTWASCKLQRLVQKSGGSTGLGLRRCGI